MSSMEPVMSAVLRGDFWRSFRADAVFCTTRGCAKPPPRAESSNAFGVPAYPTSGVGFPLTACCFPFFWGYPGVAQSLHPGLSPLTPSAYLAYPTSDIGLPLTACCFPFFEATRGYAKPPPRAESFNAFRLRQPLAMIRRHRRASSDRSAYRRIRLLASASRSPFIASRSPLIAYHFRGVLKRGGCRDPCDEECLG